MDTLLISLLVGVTFVLLALLAYRSGRTLRAMAHAFDNTMDAAGGRVITAVQDYHHYHRRLEDRRK